MPSPEIVNASIVTWLPTRDISWMDSVLRHPEIYERITDDTSPPMDAISVAKWMDAPGTVALKILVDSAPAGFFIGVPKAPGVYEVHTNILPEHRGRAALEAAKQCRDAMFTTTDCRRLSSLCPMHHPETLKFARAAGFCVDWMNRGSFIKSGVAHDAAHVSLTLNEWTRLAAAQYQPYGRLFHDVIERVLGEPPHADDDWHDAMAGLTWFMALHGRQPEKAEGVYNAWAAPARYAPVKFLGQRAGRFYASIGSAVIGVTQEMDVELIMKGNTCH